MVSMSENTLKSCGRSVRFFLTKFHNEIFSLDPFHDKNTLLACQKNIPNPPTLYDLLFVFMCGKMQHPETTDGHIISRIPQSIKNPPDI